MASALYYAKVTNLDKLFEFSTNKYVHPERQSGESSKVKGNTEEARTINSHLDYLKNQVLEAEKKIFKKDITLNSENLKDDFFCLPETKQMLIPIFENHNNKIKELIGKEYAPGTLERYTTSPNCFRKPSNGYKKTFSLFKNKYISYLKNDYLTRYSKLQKQ